METVPGHGPWTTTRALEFTTPIRTQLQVLQRRLQSIEELAANPARDMSAEVQDLHQNLVALEHHRQSTFQAVAAQTVQQAVTLAHQAAVESATTTTQAVLKAAEPPLQQAISTLLANANAQMQQQCETLLEATRQQLTTIQLADPAPRRLDQATSSNAMDAATEDWEPTDEETCGHAEPRNPRLPPYNGSSDPGLWLRQVEACFNANRTPKRDQGNWMVTALQGDAMRFWFFECTRCDPTPEVIATQLCTRFRSLAHDYDVASRLASLKMRNAQFSDFWDRFRELMALNKTKPTTDLLFTFTRALTDDYREAVLFQRCDTLEKAVEICRAKEMSTRSSASTPQFTQSRRRSFGRSTSRQPRASSR